MNARMLPSWDVDVLDGIWVVASPGGPEVVDEAIEILEAMLDGLARFMDKAPTLPIRVLLLIDEEELSEMHYQLYGTESPTPFGFYEDENRLIVLNAQEGMGPLAHEVVHPHVDVDFPGAPPWIDEGLASLFEASEDDEDGTRIGIHNGRIQTAKEAALSDEPLLPTLFSLTSDEFYAAPYDVKYAVARYFWMYLQDTGELVLVYRALRKAGPDADHVRVVEDTLGENIEEIEDDFRGWVLDL
jgi:hypothetical protein